MTTHQCSARATGGPSRQAVELFARGQRRGDEQVGRYHGSFRCCELSCPCPGVCVCVCECEGEEAEEGASATGACVIRPSACRSCANGCCPSSSSSLSSSLSPVVQRRTDTIESRPWCCILPRLSPARAPGLDHPTPAARPRSCSRARAFARC